MYSQLTDGSAYLIKMLWSFSSQNTLNPDFDRVEENSRKLLMFAEVFEELGSNKGVKTADPRHISELDIEALLVWMKHHGLQNVARSKYIGTLDSCLGFFGNHIISDMRRQNKLNFPLKTNSSEVDFIEEEDLQKIFCHISSCPGYNGIVIEDSFN